MMRGILVPSASTLKAEMSQLQFGEELLPKSGRLSIFHSWHLFGNNAQNFFASSSVTTSR